jgi:virulence-associated protein VapD
LQIPHIARLARFALKPKQVADMVSKYSFGEKDYHRFVEEFGGRKAVKKVKLIEELQRALFVAQIQENQEQLNWIEKILIQLLGYKDVEVRDEAVIILNMLYDGIDW